MRFFYFLILYSYSFCLLSQIDKTYNIVFHPMYGDSDLQTDVFYKGGNDSVLIETLKFYVSGIELIGKDKSVWKESNSFHLLDISNPKTLSIALKISANFLYNQFKFNLGIDSTTSVSGAMGGDLDPTKGMYWSWQSGYINFKLEGKSNRCATRNNEFQLHLGGYQYPYNGLRSTILSVSVTEQIDMVIDVEKILKMTDLSQQNQIMSPSAEAIEFSEKILKMIYVRKFEK